MTSRLKPRRKRPDEPLDWRELAEGPALRGLAEVLAAVPETARRVEERADVKARSPRGDASFKPVTREERTATAGDTPAIDHSKDDFPAPLHEGASEDLPFELAGTPTGGERPTAAYRRPHEQYVESTVMTPSPDGGPSVGQTPSVGETAPDSEPLGVKPSVGICPTEGDTPSDIVIPAESKYLYGKPRVFDLPVGVTPGAGRSGLWMNAAGTCYESKRVQRVVTARQSMSLGEERIYQMLWESGESADVYVESATSKKFSLGYDRIARLVRLNEKSVRLLLPKLIAKKILEVVAAEDSANQVGRTYRIFGQEEIVERQRAANLTHVVKSGRAVEFVWPISVGETPTAVVEPQQQRRTV